MAVASAGTYADRLHLRPKPSKISVLVHTKNAILLHVRISYKNFVVLRDCGK